jgi:hypothetical protein
MAAARIRWWWSKNPLVAPCNPLVGGETAGGARSPLVRVTQDAWCCRQPAALRFAVTDAGDAGAVGRATYDLKYASACAWPAMTRRGDAGAVRAAAERVVAVVRPGRVEVTTAGVITIHPLRSPVVETGKRSSSEPGSGASPPATEPGRGNREELIHDRQGYGVPSSLRSPLVGTGKSRAGCGRGTGSGPRYGARSWGPGRGAAGPPRSSRSPARNGARSWGPGRGGRPVRVCGLLDPPATKPSRGDREEVRGDAGPRRDRLPATEPGRGDREESSSEL